MTATHPLSVQIERLRRSTHRGGGSTKSPRVSGARACVLIAIRSKRANLSNPLTLSVRAVVFRATGRAFEPCREHYVLPFGGVKLTKRDVYLPFLSLL